MRLRKKEKKQTQHEIVTKELTVLQSFNEHDSEILCFDVSQNGLQLVIANSKGSVSLWDTRASQTTFVIEGLLSGNAEGTGGIKFSPNRSGIVYVANGTTLLELDIRTGKPVQHFKIENKKSKGEIDDEINSFEITSKFICFPMDSGMTYLLDLETQGISSFDPPHQNINWCCCFDYKNENVFTGGFDHQINQYSIEDKKSLRTLNMNFNLNENQMITNPPFVTCLQTNGPLLGYSLGDGSVGAFQTQESVVGSTKHTYLGPKPLFHVDLHTSSVNSMCWIPNNTSQDSYYKFYYKMLSIDNTGTLILNQINRTRSQPVWKCQLNIKPNQMMIEPQKFESVFISDVKDQLSLILIN